MSDHDVVVIGAGPAGISAGLALTDRGVRPLLIDRAEELAPSWRSRYDRLRLNTCRWFSHLPDRRFAKGTPLFPSRNQVIDHLVEHATAAGIETGLGIAVERIERENGTWAVHTQSDGILGAEHVVVATGHQNEPTIPPWEGRDAFERPILHAAEYRNPEPFRGLKVLVVGPGCSGMEIAYDLCSGGASTVWLSVRTPPNIVLREGPAGLPGDVIALTLLRAPVRFADAFTNFGRRMDIGDLSEYGLPVPDEGLFARFHRLGTVPAIVDKEVIEAIKAREIEIVGAVEGFDCSAVRLAADERIEPDAVICATGYRPVLEPLVGHLGVLDQRGLPSAQGAEAAAERLRFVGFTTRPAALGYMGKQAKAAAKAIARELRAGTPAQPARAATKAASSSPA